MTQLLIAPRQPNMEAPPGSGTGHAGPRARDWRIHDARAAGGDTIRLDIRNTPASVPAGHIVGHYETAARQADGSIAITRPFGNAELGLDRYLRGTGDVWLRFVAFEAGLVHLSASPVGLSAGDVVTGAASGATGVVDSIEGAVLSLSSVTGLYAKDEAVTVGGSAILGAAGSALSVAEVNGRVAHIRPDAVGVRSEWSSIRRKPATTGAPRLNFALSNATPLVGQAVEIHARLEGTGKLRPRHEASFMAKLRGASEPYRVHGRAAESPFGDDRTISRGDIATFFCKAAGETFIDWSVLWFDDARNLQVTTGTARLTAVDPAEHFTAAQTFDVDGTGTHARAIPGSHRYVDLDAALAAAGATGAPCRIRLESDQTYPCTSLLPLGACGAVYVEGLEPVVAQARIEPQDNAHMDGPGWVALYRVGFEGEADTTDPEAPPGPGGLRFLGRDDVSLVEVAVERLPIGIHLSDAPGSHTNIIDCRIDGSGDTALFGSKPCHLAVRGLQQTMLPGTVRGADDGAAEASAPYLTDHGGAIRMATPTGRRGFSEIAFYVYGSWKGPSQTPLGFFSEPDGTVAPSYFGQIWGEGQALAIEPAAGASVPNSTDLVIDGVQTVFAQQIDSAIRIRMGGVTVRNVSITMPDKPVEPGAASLTQVFDIMADGVGNVLNEDRITVEACTLVDRRTAANAVTGLAMAPDVHPRVPAGQVVLRDTVVAVTARSEAAFPPLGGFDEAPRWAALHDGGLVATITSAAGVEPRAYGVSAARPELATPAIGTALPTPLPGNAIIGAGGSGGPVTDLLGRTRPSIGPSAGALEP